MAYMNGIDISSYQSGINLEKVPCDFVIVKATQGNWYINPDCARAVDQALNLKKAVGIYTYLDGKASPEAQIDFFFKNCKGWLGKVVWCIDWESGDNTKFGNNAWLDKAIKRLAKLTGKPPIVYASAAVFPWSTVKSNNCGAWVAQYASNSRTGYQATPWNEGKYACAIRQYSSAGRLANFNGNLDLNKFYGDRATWNKYIAGVGSSNSSTSSSKPATSTSKPSASSTKKSNETIAAEVIAGHWGNGEDRKKRLANAGYNYSAIQAIVNKKVSAKKVSSGIKYTVKRGDTLSGIAAKYGVKTSAITGYKSGNPNVIGIGEVLTINGGKKASTSNVIKYTVRSGDNLSTIAARYGVKTSAISGYKSGNPNVIGIGEVLTIRK